MKNIFPFWANWYIMQYEQRWPEPPAERKNDMHQRMELLPGVWLQGVRTDRFKSACLSFSLLRPLCRQEAALNALLPNVLIQGSARHESLQDISRALDQLYGASMGPLVRKCGEIQTCGFYLSFLEDRFAMTGDRILEPMLDLLREILLEPLLEQGAFLPAYVEREKENLISTIESGLNDKRAYADRQMLRAMCREDGFGVPRLGEIEDVRAITPASLYRHYRRVLASSRIEIFYAGSADLTALGEQLRALLRELPRESLAGLPFAPMPRRPEPQYLEETMELTQGKLSMGFTTGITTRDPRFPALMVCNALFGGGLTCKLFQNVRERLSLCYYVSSMVYGAKGIVMVSSGIDTSNYTLAKDEILRQLEACQAGDITPEELTAAQEAICSSLKTVPDSVGRMEDYALFCILNDFPLEPEAYRAAARAVTVEDAAAAAREIRLDTIFFLKGASQ